MHPYTAIAIVCAVVIFAEYRRRNRSVIFRVPGPKPTSFFLGNVPELLQSQAGEAERKWQKEFGSVIRIRAPLGATRLLISDPKAIQYICQTAGYNYPREPERRETSLYTMGRGLLHVEGLDHERQRKVMRPAFGGPETRAFLPIFTEYASQITAQWKDALASTKDQSMVFDVPSWLSRATLDAIGVAAFDYQFGAMANEENELGKAYFNLLADAFGSPSNWLIFTAGLQTYFPRWLLGLLRARSERFQRMRNTERVAVSVAKALLDTKEDAHVRGKGKRDVMSLLVSANASENKATKMSEEEIVSQMRTLMLAGHETTANTLSWTLLELARKPEIQDKLRAEIRAVEQAVHARGHTDFSAADLEGMTYLGAVMKESLRLNPVAYNVERAAGRDDVIPLSRPIVTTSGEVLHELPVPKGLRLSISIIAYNRNPNVFGTDPDSFIPERWLNGSIPKRETSVGVYGNLFTFSGGLRTCIGWRFALLEMQAFLVELIRNFEFSLTADAGRIRREACLVMMVPTLEGQSRKGAQLPLLVRPATSE